MKPPVLLRLLAILLALLPVALEAFGELPRSPTIPLAVAIILSTIASAQAERRRRDDHKAERA